MGMRLGLVSMTWQRESTASVRGWQQSARELVSRRNMSIQLGGPIMSAWTPGCRRMCGCSVLMSIISSRKLPHPYGGQWTSLRPSTLPSPEFLLLQRTFVCTLSDKTVSHVGVSTIIVISMLHLSGGIRQGILCERHVPCAETSVRRPKHYPQ